MLTISGRRPRQSSPWRRQHPVFAQTSLDAAGRRKPVAAASYHGDGVAANLAADRVHGSDVPQAKPLLAHLHDASAFFCAKRGSCESMATP